jgi:hypothetical protein
MIRFRLEILGRPGWFRPGVEATYPSGSDREAVKESLWKMLRSYAGPLREGETLSLAQVLTPERYGGPSKR